MLGVVVPSQQALMLQLWDNLFEEDEQYNIVDNGRHHFGSVAENIVNQLLLHANVCLTDLHEGGAAPLYQRVGLPAANVT